MAVGLAVRPAEADRAGRRAAVPGALRVRRPVLPVHEPAVRVRRVHLLLEFREDAPAARPVPAVHLPAVLPPVVHLRALRPERPAHRVPEDLVLPAALLPPRRLARRSLPKAST